VNYKFLIIIFIFILSSTSQASIQSSCISEKVRQNTFYIASSGDNRKGDGSFLNPWASIRHAAGTVPDNSLILVKPGTYEQKIKISKSFKSGITIRSQVPYMAKLTGNQRVVALVSEASNIEIEGFEISHINKNAKPLVVHIDGWGRNNVNNITLRNNIIHDSYNNDLLKINNGAENIKVLCNIFYNQGDSDEHIDINSAKNVVIKNNIFFNDFEASSRYYTKKSSSFIAIKDSNGKEDIFIGAHNITLDGNIFLNWQGSHGHGFILVGEDGKPYFEADSVEIYNNLLLGNSKHPMRSPLGIKGAKNVFFYHNTISGDLPSNAYAIRINKEGKNFPSENINLYSNIWADNTGSMGNGPHEKYNDFSDTLPFGTESFLLFGNVYWNGNKKIPSSFLDIINYSDDTAAIIRDPGLKIPSELIALSWNANKRQFADSSVNIEQIFLNLIYKYAIPEYPRTTINKEGIPKSDIIQSKRSSNATIGAFQTD
jgi:hypothetical protein